MKRLIIDDVENKYNNYKLKTEPISNFDFYKKKRKRFYEFLNYVKSDRDKSELIEKDRKIISSNIELFTNKFGKEDFIYKGEYKMYAWVVEYKDCKAIIFSGNGKGTTIEIILNDNNRPFGDVQAFYQKYKNIIESYE